jgi:selenocysteine lyase/cysteine desulfurase
VISSQRREGRSGNTCFLADDVVAVEDHLAENGILVWADCGRVRVSGHLYNGSKDVDHLIRILGDMK